MNIQLDLHGGVVTGGAADFYAGDTGRVTLHAGLDEVSLALRSTPSFDSTQTIALDVYNPQPTNERIFLRFTDVAGRVMQFDLALFPLVRARAVFRLKWLDGQLHFPPLSPGTLKSHMAGDGLDVREVTQLDIGLWKGYLPSRKLEVYAAFVTDEAIDIPVPQGKTVDALGQWIQKDWPGKVADVDALGESLRAATPDTVADFPEGYDTYGGWADTQFEATGFFRVEKANGRWQLIDPAGHTFFSAGAFGVYPGEPGWIRGVEGQFENLPSPEGPYASAYCKAGDLELYRRKFSGMFPDDTPLYAPAVANLIHAHGPKWYEAWTRMTASRLRQWGVNTLSMFSDPAFIRDSGLPYVIMLEGYPVTKQTIFREFADVYAPEYEALCKRYAEQLTAHAENPLMIGYFLNNEPTWGFVPNVNLAEKTLAMEAPTHTRDALIRYLAERYQTIEAFNAAWHLSLPDFEALRRPLAHAADLSAEARADTEAFTREMIDRYAALPSRYARLAAPNHLNLGMRFASAKNDSLLVTSRYFDVYSFNCYQATPVAQMNQVAEYVDKPMLIGEFHFGALDAGLPSPSLFRVASQQARGDAYMRYVQSVAMHPCGVGAHYFAYNDQPVWGRYDGENYQFGFVDICHTPYAPFVDQIAKTHHTLKAVIEGTVAPLGGETIRL